VELTDYEIALQKYYSKLEGYKMPLNSWSFYASAFQTMKNELADVRMLQALVLLNSWQQNWNFNEEFANDTVIVVTDASLKIVFASKNMVEMNGYVPEEVIGNSPRMFQGELTNTTISSEIGLAVRNQQPFDKVILNYCKDGSLYKCRIKGFPIFNDKGELKNFIAFENIAA
jgi:PAS domain S-box-containing protein